MSPDEKVLMALYEAGSEPVSIRKLATLAGLGQNGLRERIEGLINTGYVIENHPHAGCRLLAAPDALMAEDLRARLTVLWRAEGRRQKAEGRGWKGGGREQRAGDRGQGTRERGGGAEDGELKMEDGGESTTSKIENRKSAIGNSILVFQETSSTNDLAHRLAEEGHPEGLVVVAESQTAGRGRQGRKWVSPGGKGLWFSVLLRPDLAPESSSRLTVMAAVVVATVLRRATSLPLRVKWPNDIHCHGRKVAGILVETRRHSARPQAAPETGADLHPPPITARYGIVSGFPGHNSVPGTAPSAGGRGGGTGGKIENRIRHAVVGIGIDVNLEKSDFPNELRATATSLKMETTRSFHRPSLLADILFEIDRARRFLTDDNFPRLIQQWIDLDETLGRQVLLDADQRFQSRAAGSHRPTRGLAVDMDSDGALLVRTDDGRTERVMAGDVHLEIPVSPNFSPPSEKSARNAAGAGLIPPGGAA